MGVSFFHDSVSEFVRNGYNSLFSRRAFCGRLDFLSLVAWLGKCHIVNLEDFLVWQSREYFFDFEDASSRVDGLGIG